MIAGKRIHLFFPLLFGMQGVKDVMGAKMRQKRLHLIWLAIQVYMLESVKIDQIDQLETLS